MGAEFVFMNDNVQASLPCKHRKRMPSQLEYITRLDWPASSTDLNPVEQLLDMLGRRVAARQPLPTRLMELLEEWCNIPQDQINNLILSISRRCIDCIAYSGRLCINYHDKYVILVFVNRGFFIYYFFKLASVSKNRNFY
ncbi:DDE_3 domain-containing protein [Trichonephila clavipes]|nr:DDE_3 domain-containing protein [Trichonephila clavipes]